MQKVLTFFSKNISIYAIFNDQSFNVMLTNDIVSFEQLGPGFWSQRVSVQSLIGRCSSCVRVIHSLSINGKED